MSRPSEFTDEMAELICDRIADGESLRAICDEEEMPGRSTVLRWLKEREEFRGHYARAREDQLEHWAEQIVEIADEGRNDSYRDDNGNVRTDHDVVQRSRLRVDTRKWLMSKLAPKKYGDKLQVGGADDLAPVQISKIERVIVSVTDQRATLIEAQRSEAEQEEGQD